jgi:hypothetical protein
MMKTPRGHDDEYPRVPDPRMISAWQAPAPARMEPARRDEPSAPPDDDGTLVRPYLVTGGRTRPVQDGLRVETLVYAMPAALHAPLKFERRRIVELCQTPRSVAEIAVALALPLGVARVLVADLITGDLVTVQEATYITIDMLERIRDRVRSL